MKIIAIRLKNLTSIEGSVEIDFTVEPLSSAGIFAISGATGAGKSTLLDALCLALYDKAPRFAASVESINLADVGDNQINQSDVRNLLRRGTSDGYAEVDFQGVDGHRYRSRWSVRRTRNKASGSLQPQVLEVKDLDTEKEFQGTKKELLAQLVELVGLTYEQFTRTVLLAQNDFATFLKSRGAAKAELLEKLTGTGVYSRISQEIFARNKAARQQVADQDKKSASAVEQLRISYHSLSRLLNRTDVESLQLEQIEVILNEEKDTLETWTKVNEERLGRLNSFGYPSLVDEQGQIQKELTRLQNIKKLTEEQSKSKQDIEKLEKEVTACTQQLAEQDAVVKALQRLYENARMAVGKDVKALRQQLQEGEACPVCGSTTHPYHREQEVVDTLYRNMEQEYNTAVSAYQQINNRSIVLQRDLTHQRATEVQIKEQLSVLQQEGLPAGEEEHIQNRLNELAERISAYQHLYAEWQQNDEKIKKLRTHCDALRENVSQCRLAAQKVSAAKEQSAILQKAAVDEQQRFEVIAKALDALRQERSLLLKGKSADEAEAAVARREKELNEALEKARKQVEGVQNHLSGLQGEMKQLSVVIEELREQQKGIEFPEQLPQAIAKQQEDNLNTERTLSTAEARLLQQAKNKTIFEQITKELTEKQAVAVRWAKLNKLIGSADGAKFKVIAQSYTLNLLLLHANKHLAYLSKRYKLQQVPDTLALQVIDCDMCDEIRTVYSLSGGESFLISLALALGLSSLSSNNLKVESLFIDEGFGSLDADSLRTAMEALEQLQMQGRKIGVISHVQEMSERISVQVQVHKKINGKSVLTVVG
jgi:exonuclease SbcC